VHLPDKGNVDAQVAVDRAAVIAEENTKGNTAPIGVLRVAVRTHLLKGWVTFSAFFALA
jgi:hypothetical protein